MGRGGTAQGFFQFLAVINKTRVNILMPKFFLNVDFSLGWSLRKISDRGNFIFS